MGRGSGILGLVVSGVGVLSGLRGLVGGKVWGSGHQQLPVTSVSGGLPAVSRAGDLVVVDLHYNEGCR